MPGTRTAPDVTGAPSFKELSLRWIDAVGDKRSDSSLIDATATDVEIEAVAAKMVLASNASLYAIRLTEVFEGAVTKANALAAVRESVQDNIVYHAKDTGRVDRRSFIPSPLAANFVADTETPDDGATTITEMITAWLAVWKGTFASVSLRFSERREINEKVTL